MEHVDHVALLRPGVPPGGSWADIGAGDGAFTLALADLLGPGGSIVAIDRDGRALKRNAAATHERFPATQLRTLVGDLTKPLDVDGDGGLDGIVAANSLHYVPSERQSDVVRDLAAYLKPGARFVVVEYDAERGNPWVPHPISYRAWQWIAMAAGLVDTRLVGRVPSRFLGAIYSAVSRVP
jgi:ubiquinone/menaquinone biosynthesis C-methylase UbiE